MNGGCRRTAVGCWNWRYRRAAAQPGCPLRKVMRASRDVGVPELRVGPPRRDCLVWQCYNLPMSKPRPFNAKPLSVLLNDVFSYAKQGFAARELVRRGAEIAGKEIAAHPEPLKMQWPRPVEGQPQEPATLVLRVEGPMALEIQHSSDVILQRVNRFFGWSAVGKLALRQAPLSRRDRPSRPRPPDPKAVAAVAETLSSVED